MNQAWKMDYLQFLVKIYRYSLPLNTSPSLRENKYAFLLQK